MSATTKFNDPTWEKIKAFAYLNLKDVRVGKTST